MDHETSSDTEITQDQQPTLRKFEIKVEGSASEKHQCETNQSVEVRLDVDKMRAFMIEFYLFFHQGWVEEYVKKEQKDYDFDYWHELAFHCPKCDLVTHYSHKPLPNYPAPLCMSTLCIADRLPEIDLDD